MRGTISQFLDIGRSSHALKAGAGYEFGEETFNRLANGWGTITNISLSGVPALRTRYFTPQPPQLGQGRTYSIFVQDDVTIARRTSLNVGVLLNRDDFSQNVEGSGGCPADDPAEGRRGGVRVEGRYVQLPAVRLRRRNPAAPGCQLSGPGRNRRQGVCALGPLLQHGSEIERPESRAKPYFPDPDRLRPERQRPVERSARLDDRKDDRPRYQADLHGRDPGRVCDAIRRGLQPGRVLHVAWHAQLHRGRAVTPERHRAQQRTVRRREPAVRSVRGVPISGASRTYRAVTMDVRRRLCRRLDERHQLHVEPVRR